MTPTLDKLRLAIAEAHVPRPLEVHKTYCPHCPSHYGPDDPEAEEIRKGVKARIIDPHDAVFVCAWRPNKLCRGICEEIWASLPGDEP